ncbi:hypothetical protein [Streptomyces sp. NRRL WC-3742]|uniref:hypothetical protein n=1 Tax=Streptomyces sp. NRRL WC-3742 TaxID=1463934 RepID=UPI0004C9C8F3|nr:hypothetical protein [Streptomyces sp. NRRL WC-3742]
MHRPSAAATARLATAFGLALAACGLFASPASAAVDLHQPCYANWGSSVCTTVTAIAPGSYLAQHNAPDYAHGVQEGVKLHNGDEVPLVCWTTGAPDADGHGDTYWFQVSEATVYVNDYYLNTGRFADWSPHVDHC